MFVAVTVYGPVLCPWCRVQIRFVTLLVLSSSSRLSPVFVCMHECNSCGFSWSILLEFMLSTSTTVPTVYRCNLVRRLIRFVSCSADAPPTVIYCTVLLSLCVRARTTTVRARLVHIDGRGRVYRLSMDSSRFRV